MVTNIRTHTVSPSSSYIFDTNVWIYIFGPIASHDTKKQSIYSSLLRDILSRKAGLYITSLILSEYVNKVIRIEYSNWKIAHPEILNNDFKRVFRKTKEYKDCLKDVRDQVKEILKSSEQKSDDFNALNVDQIFVDASNELDFNDCLIASACSRGNCILVTDDKDFENTSMNLNIIKS